MIPLQEIRRILVVRTDRMGDLLLSLPAVYAIRKGFPDAEIALLIQKEWICLLEGYPDVDQILPWDGGQGRSWLTIWRTALWLRRQRFDAILVLNPTRLFHVASFIAGIPVRIGYRRKWGGSLTHSMEDTKAGRDLHETEYNLELVRLLGIQCPPETHFSLPEHPESQQRARDLLAAHGVAPSVQPIALHPWSTNPAKSLPADFFWAVAGQLREFGNRVLLIGTPPPCGAEPRPPSGMVNLMGKTPLKLLPELLRACAVLVSNDSGPVHVAAAVGTPTVVVAPKEHASLLARWRPLGEGHRILLSPAPEEVVVAVGQMTGQGPHA